jgi:hypothetical protein
MATIQCKKDIAVPMKACLSFHNDKNVTGQLNVKSSELAANGRLLDLFRMLQRFGCALTGCRWLRRRRCAALHHPNAFAIGRTENVRKVRTERQCRVSRRFDLPYS